MTVIVRVQWHGPQRVRVRYQNSARPYGAGNLSLPLIQPAKQPSGGFFKRFFVSPCLSLFHGWNLAKDLTHEAQKNSVNGAQKYE